MSVRVSTLVWGRSQARGHVLMLMLALADQANDEGYCWPKQSTLARRLRLGSDRAVRKAIDAAQELGELTVIHRTHEGRYIGNAYQIRLDVLRQYPDLWDGPPEPQFRSPEATTGTTVPIPPEPQFRSPPEPQFRTITVSNNHQENRQIHVVSPDGEAHAPTPTEPDSGQEQPSPALSGPDQTAGKGSRQGKAASSEKVPGAAAALLALWNDHRGPLPRADVLTDARAKALERLSTALGSEAPALFRDAVCEVALDPFWKERRYGLDNLLSKVPQKAEAYRARTQKASASPLARRRYD